MCHMSSIGLVVIEKKGLNTCILMANSYEWPWSKSQRQSLTLGNYQLIISLRSTYQVRIMNLASTAFKKINFSKIFQFKCIRRKIWPWRKVGQGQPRSLFIEAFWSLSPRCYMPSFKIIRIIVLEKILPYIGVAAILVIWPRPCI